MNKVQECYKNISSPFWENLQGFTLPSALPDNQRHLEPLAWQILYWFQAAHGFRKAIKSIQQSTEEKDEKEKKELENTLVISDVGPHAGLPIGLELRMHEFNTTWHVPSDEDSEIFRHMAQLVTQEYQWHQHQKTANNNYALIVGSRIHLIDISHDTNVKAPESIRDEVMGKNPLPSSKELYDLGIKNIIWLVCSVPDVYAPVRLNTYTERFIGKFSEQFKEYTSAWCSEKFRVYVAGVSDPGTYTKNFYELTQDVAELIKTSNIHKLLEPKYALIT